MIHLWPALASAVLTVALALGYRRLRPGRARPATYRTAFLVAVGLLLPPASWLAAGHQLPPYAALLVPVGGFLGGLAATARAAGLVEENAPPTAAVREKVLAHHAALEPRRLPVGKRAFDVAGALAGLAVTLPLWPVAAFLVWLEEPGPVFFIKNSVGRNGITFRQLKLRSMTQRAERLTGPVVSPAGDPRTLRVGWWLRRWHIDEMTELVNVLGGTMSLVGPRPLRTVSVLHHLEEVPGFAERHTVRPGIACIAQIESCHVSPAQRLRKDRVYLRRMGLRLDLTLLWRAVVTTLQGRRGPPAAGLPDPPYGRTEE